MTRVFGLPVYLTGAGFELTAVVPTSSSVKIVEVSPRT
jgi:hypothetical protein